MQKAANGRGGGQDRRRAYGLVTRKREGEEEKGVKNSTAWDEGR
jgi:hypothetical protein